MTVPEPSTSLPPHLPPDALIGFVDAHRPTLEAGTYQVTVTQQLDSFDYRPAAHGVFEVSGPRFTLTPQDISSVYPPDGSRGHFERTLPHVQLTRSTLPWERTAGRRLVTDAPPWLALVLVDAAAEVASSMTVAEARAAGDPTATNDQFPGLAAELSDDAQAGIKVVSVPVDHLPNGDDLAWSTHVRVVGGVETATVVGTRLPQPGRRYAAHLVSVENLYDIAADGTVSLWAGSRPTGTVRLISLHRWDFTCQVHDRHGFKSLMSGLSVELLRGGSPPAGTAAAADYHRSGFVALDHQLRQGERVTSWYHGPLLPVIPPGPALGLPVRESDDLLLYDESTGMLDVSYAGAWELGRLLALQNDKVALGLHAWKREAAQRERRAAQRDELSHLAHLHPREGAAADFDATPWFVEQLIRLGGVPFGYLIADASMLPSESIRFFGIDTQWVQCLVDGAFSIGRTNHRELALDMIRRTELPDVGEMSGFLLRSEAVSGYPGLMLEAYPSGTIRDETTRLEHVRIAYLAPNVLLAMYAGHVAAVNVHLHPQTLHFGFADSVTIDSPVVSMSDLASKRSAAHSGELAKDLIVPAPFATFTRGSL